MTSRRAYLIVVAVLAAIALTLSAVAKSNRESDHASVLEAGPGPRSSANGLYVVALQGARALAPRTPQTFHAVLIDGADGQPVTDAKVTFDRAVPESGPALAGHSRLTSNRGSGWYEVRDVTFDADGSWLVTFTIDAPLGIDTVTFQLSVS